MPITRFVANPPPSTPVELPAEGFPPAEHTLREWFLDKYGREASAMEIGVIMAAMSARDSKEAPLPGELSGWRVEPATAPD